jgi:hypothetical protein
VLLVLSSTFQIGDFVAVGKGKGTKESVKLLAANDAIARLKRICYTLEASKKNSAKLNRYLEVRLNV